MRNRKIPAMQGLSGLPSHGQYGLQRFFRRVARGLMNLHTRDYDYDMLENLACTPRNFRPSALPARSPGMLTEEAAYHLGLRAGIPVSVGGGNGMCESVGAGGGGRCVLHEPPDTAAWIAGQSREPFFDRAAAAGTHLHARRQKLFRLRRNALRGEMRQLGAEVLRSARPEPSDAAASNIPAGADGLIFLPYLEGERSPVYDEQAQGVFFRHDPAAPARALSARGTRGRWLRT